MLGWIHESLHANDREIGNTNRLIDSTLACRYGLNSVAALGLTPTYTSTNRKERRRALPGREVSHCQERLSTTGVTESRLPGIGSAPLLNPNKRRSRSQASGDGSERIRSDDQIWVNQSEAAGMSFRAMFLSAPSSTSTFSPLLP